MRVLYVAIDQQVPGTTGGSVHVVSVAEGLAARGHDVQVLVSPGAGPFPDDPSGRVSWVPLRPPLGARQLRWWRSGRVFRLARAFRPDVVMERYYNFGGEGLRAAASLGAVTVLEVNAPVTDYPGSPKRRLDRWLLVEPMRRWREWQCAHADLIVTPSAAILPAIVPQDRILEIEWGADTVRFHPGTIGPLPFTPPAGATLVVFAGAFRSWHGARHLVEAIGRLRERGRTDIAAVLIGEGPELAPARQAAAGLSGVVFTGPVPHTSMPACLAAADIGVAPFDVAAHAPLAQAFYWSPLKVFEYMASGLPVVAPDIPRLRTIVRHEQEGLLYDAAVPGALAAALERLADESTSPRSGGRLLRARLGAAARARVERDFGWDVHCRVLEASLRRALESRQGA